MSIAGRTETGMDRMLAALQSHLRQLRPEEQIAFALIELHGRELDEAAGMLRVAPTVLRQRMLRARRKLLFVARRDPMVAHYLRVAETLRAAARG
jgi:DNA-directed RNA polymerase specialized sigma24 family protein